MLTITLHTASRFDESAIQIGDSLPSPGGRNENHIMRHRPKILAEAIVTRIIRV
jgi:hypothetical protein